MTNIEKIKEKAIAQKPTLSIENLIKQSADQLKMALPKHMNPERIVRIALTTLKMNPKLYQCDAHSLLGALFQSAQLGLEPNLNGEAWIVPYLNKGQLMAQFQIGAYGLVKLYWNHNSAVSLQVETVREKDFFEYDLGACTLKHIPPVFGPDRGNSVGYYAVAYLTGGGRMIKVLSKFEAENFGKRFSKCFDRKTGMFMSGTPWAEHFDEMAKKTVLKQLMKLLPKSIEIQKALAMDETVKTKIAVDMVEVPDETDYAELTQEKPSDDVLSDEEKKQIIEAEKNLK